MENSEIILNNLKKYYRTSLRVPAALFETVFKYILRKNLSGGAYLTTAMLYMMLKAAGEDPRAVAGEAKINQISFDHAWIELHGKIIDPAIYRLLPETIETGFAIFNSENLLSCDDQIPKYLLHAEHPLFPEFERIVSKSIGAYLSEFVTGERYPLTGWELMAQILSDDHFFINTDYLLENAYDDRWEKRY